MKSSTTFLKSQLVNNNSNTEQLNNHESLSKEKDFAYLKHLLYSIFSAPPSSELQNYFDELREPKELTYSNFIVGVQKFIKISGINPDKRKEVYGHRYSGLHYSNELTEMIRIELNMHINLDLHINFLPPGWKNIEKEYSSCLSMNAKSAVQALNNLLKGPASIDCGMFCQLAILFGIRYILGDKKIEEIFSEIPLYISQSLFSEICNNDPISGNPFYAFFNKSNSLEKDKIALTCIGNSELYLFVHPGGSYGAHNCIVINELYNVFDPHLKKSSDLTKFEIDEILYDAFNLPFDNNDLARINYYKKNPDKIHPFIKYGNDTFSYEQLAQVATGAAHNNFKMDKETWEQERGACYFLTFDLQKFECWLKQFHENKNAKSYYNLFQYVDAREPEKIQQTDHEDPPDLNGQRLQKVK